jgi:hypothetical protein
LPSVDLDRDPSGNAKGRLMMKRLSLALLLAIALVTGVAAGTTFNGPEISSTYPGLSGSSETARAFYDGMNQALAGGGTDVLAALLGPGFLDHDKSIGEAQTAEAFLERIRMLGQERGVELLSVESVEVSGSSLIVHVAQGEPSPRALAGISIEQRASQPIFEVLRIVRGRIIDRWTPGIWWLHLTEFDDVVVQSSRAAGIATLVRTTIVGEAAHGWISPGPGFLLIESGFAELQTIHADGVVESIQLERDSVAGIAPGDTLELWAAHGEPVTMLVYSTISREAAEARPSVSTINAQRAESEKSILWNGPTSLGEVSAGHRPGTFVLPAGKDVLLTGSTGATLLLAIDAGSVELTTPGGVASVLGDDTWPVDHPDVVNVEAHRAVAVIGASTVALRNVSEYPATILVVVIKSDAPGGPPIGRIPRLASIS